MSGDELGLRIAAGRCSLFRINGVAHAAARCCLNNRRYDFDDNDRPKGYRG